jgi:hypothetical protein
VHRFVNDLQRQVGTMLLGRRMYDVLVVWETMDTAGQTGAIRDFADLWRASDKVVYSRTLERAASARTRIERDFGPEAVRRMKASADRDLSIGVLTWPAKRSRPDSWTRSICSSARSRSEAGPARSPTTSR